MANQDSAFGLKPVGKVGQNRRQRRYVRISDC